MSFTSWCFEQQDSHKRDKPAKVIPIRTPGYRTCTQCGQEKPDSEYYIKDGRPKQPCKECSREYRNRHYLDLKKVREMSGEEMRNYYDCLTDAR